MPVLESVIKESELKAMTDYYLARYDEVWIVHCLECKQPVAIEVRGQVGGFQMNENGITTITIEDRLAASRVRHDTDFETGERAMGYECGWRRNPKYDETRRQSRDNLKNLKCSNNTMVGKMEEAFAPAHCRETRRFEIQPHEIDDFTTKVNEAKQQNPYKESFRREKIK